MRVAVLDDYQSVAESCADWSELPADCAVVFFHDHVDFGPGLIERLAPFDVICAMRERTPFTAELLGELPNLKLLVTTGKRNAAIDVTAASAQGVIVCGTNSPGHATAELAMGLIVSLARNLVVEAASVESGGWQVGLGRDLRGATLGIVGLGRLGAQVATLGKAFDMDVVAWSENLTEERCREIGVRRVDKETMFREADFITIHLRLSERTKGLVGSTELALMKNDAYLVNTSRGPIVDMDALLDTLLRGRIGGAAIDVFENEPLATDDPLRLVPRLLLTPHIGYVTRETYSVFYGESIEVVSAWLHGNPINVINN